jgi:putative flippase GtrA
MLPLSKRKPGHLLRFTVVRFGLVALFGETLYFILYGLVLSLTDSTSRALAIAGGICLLVNAYIHSCITFRVRFSWKLLLGYFQIQLAGFVMAFLIGLALERAGTDKWFIALITYLSWAGLSFFLTNTLYRNGESHSAVDSPAEIQKR